MIAIVPILLTTLCMSPQIMMGRATRYGDPGDRLAGGKPACAGRVSQKKYDASTGRICAHRHFPCGTSLILMTAAGRMTTCTVMDRGPYGARLGHKRLWKYRANDPGKWITDLDLSPKVADALGLTLYVGRMIVFYQRKEVVR